MRDNECQLIWEAYNSGGNLYDEYSALSPDKYTTSPKQYTPKWQHDQVGNYWTEPVDVPLSKLSDVEAKVIDKNRLTSIYNAISEGVELSPLEISANKDGSTFLIDGNHRLVAYRNRTIDPVKVRFTFPNH